MSGFNSLGTLERASLVMAGVLIVALLPLPYGLYTVIRVGVAVLAVCWAVRFFNTNKTALGVIAVAVAVLFQPLWKITMDRVSWNIIDILLAAGLIVLVLRPRLKWVK